MIGCVSVDGRGEEVIYYSFAEVPESFLGVEGNSPPSVPANGDPPLFRLDWNILSRSQKQRPDQCLHRLVPCAAFEMPHSHGTFIKLPQT